MMLVAGDENPFLSNRIAKWRWLFPKETL